MNDVYLKTITSVLLYIFSVNSYAAIISYDLLAPDSSVNINYSNPFSNIFTSTGDGFQIYQRDVDTDIPSALLDNSNITTSDSLGIITSLNNRPFFGIVDTVNSDNINSYATASWQVNITNLSTLSLHMDIAAMGNFESSDEFTWRYSIDDNPYTIIFQSITDENQVQSYRLENNSTFMLDDPLAIGNQLLSNEFQGFSSLSLGTGSLLKLELIASTNGGSEAIAFQNVLVQGQSNIVTVNEPKTYGLIVLAVVLLACKSLSNDKSRENKGER